MECNTKLLIMGVSLGAVILFLGIRSFSVALMSDD
jgi:hypothetical protein